MILYYSLTIAGFLFYPENTNIGEKRINKKREMYTPLKSPLNGGIY
jgi:hypothetical protein